MKKSFLLALAGLLFFSLAYPQQARCQAEKNLPTDDMAQKIIGKWKPNRKQIIQMADDAIEKLTKEKPEKAKNYKAQRGTIMQILEHVTIEYKKDGVFLLNIPISPQKGTWRIEDNTKIVRINEDGKESINQIVEITKKKLVILNEEGKTMTYIAIKKWQ